MTTEENLITKVCTTIFALSMSLSGMAIDNSKVVRTPKFDAQSMIEMQKMQQAKQEASAAAKMRVGARNSYVVPRVSALVKLHNGIEASSLSGMGFEVTPLCNNFGVVTLSVDSLEALAEVDDVERISFGERKMELMLNNANASTGVTKIHYAGMSNGLNDRDNSVSLYRPYTGKGVMIGVLDTGFDPNHAMFLDKNGVSRFKVIKTRTSNPITDPERIAEFKSDNNYGSHATHVSGIAAGSFHGDNFDLEGVATNADLAMGPILNTAAELEYIKYLGEYCKERQERLVINMSYGSIVGPHDGSDLYSQTLAELINEYDIVACLSVGNDADADIVQKYTLSSNEDSMKGLLDISNTRDLNLYLTTSEATAINMSLVVVDANSQDTLISYPVIENGIPQDINVNDEYLRVNLHINQEAIHDNLAGYQLTSDNVLLTNSKYRFGYIITGEEGQSLACYTETICPFYKELDKWAEGVTSNGTTSVESCCEEVIATGAYNTTPSMKYLKSGSMKLSNSKDNGWGCEEGDVTYYSGFGTKYNGENLPHVCAPGAILESSYNRYCSLTSQKKKITHTGVYEGNIYSFCAMNGTSMSAPYMAGIAALWLEANPNLTHKEIKEIAMMTANSDYACNEGNYFNGEGKQGGAGKVDAYSGLMYILSENDATTSIDTPAEKSFLIRNTSSTDYEAFCAGATSLTATLYNMEGKVAKSNATSGNIVSISTMGLQKGIYVLKVNSNNKSQQMKIAVR